MKSIALTLAVLASTVVCAQAATEAAKVEETTTITAPDDKNITVEETAEEPAAK